MPHYYETRDSIFFDARSRKLRDERANRTSKMCRIRKEHDSGLRNEICLVSTKLTRTSINKNMIMRMIHVFERIGA